LSRKKLSATGMSTFMDSPRKYYYRYIQNLEPLGQSVVTFDHDKICGSIWAEFVDRFYKGIELTDNAQETMETWLEQTDGWVPTKARERLTAALDNWIGLYYQLYQPDDGIRTAEGSELRLENERFLGYLDGLSKDGIVHEVKSTSRAKSLAGQLWGVQNSIQVKLYCVLAKAKGIRIEFAFKDVPHAIFRSDVKEVTSQQLTEWEQQLNVMADQIFALGDDPNNYLCHPGGCSIFSKGFTGECPYMALCNYGVNDSTKLGYASRKVRR
jgi:hypothetical protein